MSNCNLPLMFSLDNNSFFNKYRLTWCNPMASIYDQKIMRKIQVSEWSCDNPIINTQLLRADDDCWSKIIRRDKHKHFDARYETSMPKKRDDHMSDILIGLIHIVDAFIFKPAVVRCLRIPLWGGILGDFKAPLTHGRGWNCRDSAPWFQMAAKRETCLQCQYF